MITLIYIWLARNNNSIRKINNMAVFLTILDGCLMLATIDLILNS
jgi:hypothetical protein